MNRKEFLSKKISETRFSSSCPRIGIRIAGIRLGVRTDQRRLEERIRNYFLEYLDEGPSCGELYVTQLAQAEESPGLWEDDDAEFDIRGDVALQRDFVARRVDNDAVALVAPGLDDAFHNLLRWYFPRPLLQAGGFLMHAAGVIRDGRGYLFFGQSGAGKSTAASLIRHSDPSARVIGDDGVIIQIAPGTGVPWIHAAPLGCGYSADAPSPLSAPLAGMFALQQARRDSLEEMSRAEGAAALLASAMSHSFDEDVEARFDLAAKFTFSRCGIRRLCFRLGPDFWKMILNEGQHRLEYTRSQGEVNDVL